MKIPFARFILSKVEISILLDLDRVKQIHISVCLNAPVFFGLGLTSELDEALKMVTISTDSQKLTFVVDT